MKTWAWSLRAMACIAFIFVCGMFSAQFRCSDRSIQAEWTETHRCVRVIDGDTIEIENGVRVRLVGVEAFEVRNGTRLDREAAAAGISPDEALGRGHEQAEALRRRIEGKDVVLRYRFYPTDRYGRRLGELVEGE